MPDERPNDNKSVSLMPKVSVYGFKPDQYHVEFCLGMTDAQRNKTQTSLAIQMQQMAPPPAGNRFRF